MNETPTGGPLPSKHVFLHELPKLSGGSKVRFLGCVVDYDVSTGSLLIEHAFPENILPTPRAFVDIQLVLESVKARDLQRGNWLNIIGYVRKTELRQKKALTATREDIKKALTPTVQALIVWDAGAIKTADYETALINQRQMKVSAEIPEAR